MLEDLAVYFADFAVDGMLSGVPVRVIFDTPTDQMLGGVGMAAGVPQVQIATASVPADFYGLTLDIPQGAFTVQQHQADGTGLSLLLLQKAGT
jgi:hypothetical protein